MGFTDLMALADQVVNRVVGGPVTYTPGVGAAVEVEGVFDAAYRRLDLGQPGVSTTSPAVFLLLVDLPSDPRTDFAATVTVNGVAYSVHEVQPDGIAGGVVLLLHRVT